MHTDISMLSGLYCLFADLFSGITKEIDQFLLIYHFQVLSRLSELEITLEAGLRHRDAALTSIAFQLTKWMNMVRFLCLIILPLKLI